jgi:hypothetical protein
MNWPNNEESGLTRCTWSETRFSTLMMFTDQRPADISRFAGDPTSVYVQMAVRLAESLARAGKHLRVFTNNPIRLELLIVIIPDTIQGRPCDAVNGNFVLIPHSVAQVPGNLSVPFVVSIVGSGGSMCRTQKETDVRFRG